MKPDQYASKSGSYIQAFCSVKPNRRTGSPGNRAATDFFADTIRTYGYQLDAVPFECLDHIRGEPRLAHGNKTFEVQVSPYSNGCDITAELVAVSTVEALESTPCQGKLLLMRGEICAEQLMPKNFVFYNPEHHQKIIALLESRKPAAIITATKRNPDQVGALYPYPLIVDGDFDIPSLYCTASVGTELASMRGETFQVKIEARRVPSMASNVIAHLNPGAADKIVISAHIDAYEDSPGASDNASGTVVLLLLAEMIANYGGDKCIEIAAFNGEDHYSAAGQMDYVKRYGSEFNRIVLAVNIDDVGYHKGKSAYSFYECSPQLEMGIEDTFQRFDGLLKGKPWFNGDHMIFVQDRVPSIAFTSENMPELMRTVTHTPLDTPDIIDPHKLVEVAQSLDALIRSL